MKLLVTLLLCVAVAYGDDEACSPDTRPRVLVGEKGTFSSPNYPGNYPHGSQCEWKIESTEVDEPIGLTFTDFVLENCVNCACDAVDVYDGEDTSAPLIASVCSPPTEPIASTSDRMYVVFRSDANVTFPGFEANWEVTDVACTNQRPKVITEPRGELISPNYPDDYPNDAECHWMINAAEGMNIELTWEDFATENSGGCPYDAVYVFDTDSSGANPTLLGVYCGTTRPPVHTSTRGTILIQFTTDFSITDRGFRLTYETVE